MSKRLKRQWRKVLCKLRDGTYQKSKMQKTKDDKRGDSHTLGAGVK